MADISSAEYSPFQPNLDQRFPISQLNFNQQSKELIMGGKITPVQWVSIFRNSPANNSEAEMLMGEIVADAVRAGQWVDIPEPQEDVEVAPTTFQREDATITIGPFPLEFKRGANILYNCRFAEEAVDQEGRRFLRPTERFMEFVKQRIGFKGLQQVTSSENVAENSPVIEEKPLSPREKIATYAELRNPRNQEITPQEITGILERVMIVGFRKFTPREVGGSVIGTMTGDSPYGVRIGVVKAIIAQALYSPDEFERFVQSTSVSEGQEAKALGRKYGTPEYSAEKQARIKAEGEKKFRGDYLTGEMEVNEVRQHRTNSAAYQTLIGIVHRIGEKYNDQKLSAEDIFRLIEANRFFSGKWNATGRNITFTDPDIREFGTQLQQVVERVWRAGRYEDIPNPLSEAQLFPEIYP